MSDHLRKIHGWDSAKARVWHRNPSMKSGAPVAETQYRKCPQCGEVRRNLPQHLGMDGSHKLYGLDYWRALAQTGSQKAISTVRRMESVSAATIMGVSGLWDRFSQYLCSKYSGSTLAAYKQAKSLLLRLDPELDVQRMFTVTPSRPNPVAAIEQETLQQMKGFSAANVVNKMRSVIIFFRFLLTREVSLCERMGILSSLTALITNLTEQKADFEKRKKTRARELVSRIRTDAQPQADPTLWRSRFDHCLKYRNSPWVNHPMRQVWSTEARDHAMMLFSVFNFSRVMEIRCFTLGEFRQRVATVEADQVAVMVKKHKLAKQKGPLEMFLFREDADRILQ
ncbi:uncharacterized protein [Littorina saxatilis]|uniref:uncharacterized protein n=1 Tax=Littorina saxatilis TaxID=31220 RepID=UPI0038B69EAC